VCPFVALAVLGHGAERRAARGQLLLLALARSGDGAGGGGGGGGRLEARQLQQHGAEVVLVGARLLGQAGQVLLHARLPEVEDVVGRLARRRPQRRVRTRRRRLARRLDYGRSA
jgi:hypothetical protein